jgi:hypothetical protein
MNGVLRRIKNGTALRSDSVRGVFGAMPEVGHSFLLFSEPLNGLPDYRREIQTSPVRVVETMGKVTRFTTENSVYELEAA